MMDLRSQFPQIDIQVRGRPLVYLDSAATVLKPQIVIDELTRYYSKDVANVHRGAHWLAENGTSQYESARAEVASFLGAADSSEIVFTRGTTESLNLVASSLTLQLKAGDEIVLTELEHHSNIVPWQILAERVGAVIRVARITAGGVIDLDHMRSLLNSRTKVISFSACSNVLGTTIDPRLVTSMAKSVGAIVVVDAAQAVTAGPINVVDWDADFVAFSGHKIFAPFGIGALYGKKARLEALAPYQGGGSMIDRVSFEKTTWAYVPQKFEAGTPNVGDALALGVALQWYRSLPESERYTKAKALADSVRGQLSALGGFDIYGAAENSALVSFNMKGIHASDVGSILDQQGIAVRTGHHCCQPLMQKLGVPATIRASFSIYNNRDDAERLVAGLLKARELLS